MSTPFMNLDLPTPSVTLGPEWATELNTAIETIDSHDHTSGKGTQIPAAGLNINGDLDFNSNKPFNLMSTQFDDQSVTLTGASNAGSIYTVSGDLYYTNSSGIAVQLTTGGTLNSSPGSAQVFETQAVSSNLSISNADTFVYLIVDTTASRAITLPLASSVTAGRIYVIKDASGQSEANNITLNVSGSDTVDGSSSQTLDSNYGSWTIVGDGTDSWYIS